jgi:hypothetical protein
MLDTNARERAETLFGRDQKRDGEIRGALKQEAARYEAVAADMRRLQKLSRLRAYFCTGNKCARVVGKPAVSSDPYGVNCEALADSGGAILLLGPAAMLAPGTSSALR